MATFNLVRNSRVFFTTNVNANTGLIPTSGALDNTNTFEIQVLDGFSFTQGTQQTTIQVSEAGVAPVRGQRAFNVSLDPVDFSFSTYVRPSGSGPVTAEERHLWNALFSANPIDETGITVGTVTSFVRGSSTTNLVTFTCAALNLTSNGIASGDVVTVGTITGTNADQWNAPAKIYVTAGSLSAATGIRLEYLEAPSVAASTAPSGGVTALKLFKCAWIAQPATTGIAARAIAHTGDSNRNQLQKFGMFFLVDSVLYAVDNCVLDQASIDFGLDGIATIAWAGKGTSLRQLPNGVVSAANPAVFSGTGLPTGTAASKNTTTANYITNKLSTMSLVGNIYGGGTTYSIALTGGNMTIANNISYVVPANLGVVNQPIGYFTGSRAISGNVTAYLKTGSGNSAQVLTDILAANLAETKFKVQIEVGGSNNAIHVDLKLNGCVLQVPTVETGDVMSTTINFTAQGHAPIIGDNTYDLESANDLTVAYYSV